jgi:molybdate transport system substrate-binding protein
MKRFQMTAAVTLLGMVLMMSTANLQAAELKILVGGGMTGVFGELGPQFEKASGHKLNIFFGTTPNLIKQATSGEPFDAGVVPKEMMKDAAARAKFAPGAMVDVARVGFGVVVRAGAAKPDIGTADKFKQAMLKAQSIATIPESAAGAQILRVFERLGIGDEMKAKTKVQTTTGAIPQAIAKGEAELGLFLSSVLVAPGVEPPVPFPPELQQDLVYTAAVSADSKEAEAAKAFINYLQTPAAAAIMKAKGMTPG